MAYSGSIGGKTFSALKVVDTAFRRCRLPAQAISAEMQQYAMDSLYLFLSTLPQPRTLSWCIEKIVLPMYQGQPVVTLPLGTVDVLNMNYRQLQQVSFTPIASANSYTFAIFGGGAPVDVVGVKFSADSGDLTLQSSSDNVNWTTIATLPGASAGEWSWLDVVPQTTTPYLRLTAFNAFTLTQAVLGNTPTEIPMGVLNRDNYVNQSNRVYQSRPTDYWYQRDLPQPVVNIWPAPNAQAELAQLIVYRQRHIMDTLTLREEVEVPQRWLDAVIDGLAERVALETPAVDINLLPLLAQKAMASKQLAYDSDGDGAPTYIQPNISGYTR